MDPKEKESQNDLWERFTKVYNKAIEEKPRNTTPQIRFRVNNPKTKPIEYQSYENTIDD